MNADFERPNPKITCGRALVRAIAETVKDPDGRIRAEDLITAIASITGELCIDATGLTSSRSHSFRPGYAMFGDEINKVIFGDVADLESVPSESVVGILRDRLSVAGYTKADFPDLVKEVLEYFAANFGRADLGNRAPVSVPAAHLPRVHSMAVAYGARSIVDRAFERLGADRKARMRAAAHALAETLIAVKDVVPRNVALLLALQTVNGTAKRAPLTDAAMEAFRKGQIPPGQSTTPRK